MAFDEPSTAVEQPHEAAVRGSIARAAPFVACAQMSACRGEWGVDKYIVKPPETLLE